MPEGREFLLRRHFAIHQASRRGGWAGTLEFVVDPTGPGTEWLTTAKAHEFLEVIGPLGKAFAYPKKLTNCLLIAEGHGASSLYFLAQELHARQKRVDMVVGAETLERVFKPIEAKRLSQSVAIMTEDGTLGDRGVVMDALADMVERTSHRGDLRRCPVAHPWSDRRVLSAAEHPRPGRGGGADGMRVRTVPDVRRARGPQGRHRLRPCAFVHRRSGVQSGSGAVGPMALGRPHPAAHAARGPARDEVVAGVGERPWPA